MIEDGIHFGLPEEEHHAIDALGSTDTKELLVNPVAWQTRRLVKLKPELELLGPAKSKDEEEAVSAGKRYGHCVHAVTLEGWDVFEHRYAAKPEQPADLLITRDQIREALGDRCSLPKSAALLDHVMEAKRHGLPDLEDDWKYEVAKYMEGREEISRRWHTQMVMLNRMLDMARADHGGQSIRSRYLSNGYPEVTVVWTGEDGVRLKARFDWLRIKAIIDVKTYAAREGLEPMQSFSDAVDRYAYDLQCSHYLDARAAMPALIADNKVFNHAPGNDVVPSEFLRRLADFPADQVTWDWIAIQTIGLPEIDVVRLDLNSLVMASAGSQVRLARQKYVEMRDRFGVDELWYASRGVVSFTDQTFRPSITGRGSERWTTIPQ